MSEWNVSTSPTTNLTPVSLQLNAYMSSNVVEIPLSSIAPKERAIVHAVTPDVTHIDTKLLFADLTPSIPAPDDFPDGGYGWVIVLACSAIRYAVAVASA